MGTAKWALVTKEKPSGKEMPVATVLSQVGVWWDQWRPCLPPTAQSFNYGSKMSFSELKSSLLPVAQDTSMHFSEQITYSKAKCTVETSGSINVKPSAKQNPRVLGLLDMKYKSRFLSLAV